MRAHQLVASMRSGDAISNHVFEIDACLRAWGYESHIYANKIFPKLRGRVKLQENLYPFLDEENDLFIYHYGIYHPNTRMFLRASSHRMFVYHNITPAHYFKDWDTRSRNLCRVGRSMLSAMTNCDIALGVSEFNRQELIQAGFDEAKTGVLPIFLSLDHFQSLQIDARLQARIKQNSVTNWITVGRVAPHKGIHDVIRIFSVYHRYINPQSHLYIIGGNALTTYNRALESLAHALGVNNQITFTGRVSDARLKTYYETADLYLTATLHEGFCVPLLESMYFDVPILARKTTAIPETLADAGVLFNRLGYDEVAHMGHLICSDQNLSQQIIQKQRQRLKALGPENAAEALQNILARLGLPVR